MNDLDVKGIPTILTLSTMTDVNKKVKSHKVNGLMVRGCNFSEKVDLPAMYTRGEIPANKSNIPTPERVAQWPHLKEIATELAPISDAPIGLLIGCNCPMALQPLDTIRSVGNQPFAQRSVLGWGVIGMLNHHQTPTDEGGLSHRIVCSGNTETKFVFKTSVKEIVTPAEVQNMMSLDFCEYDTDDKDISFEDKRFLNLMKECVHLRSDGHYEMPLPLKDAENIDISDRLCGSESQELELNDPEVKKAVVHTVLGDQSKSECHEEIPSVVDFNRFSSWLKLKRVFVLCQKFIQKLKTKCKLNLTPDKVTDSNRVTVRELSKAETLIIKSVQQHCFAEELKVLKNALDLKTSDSQSKLNLKKASTLYSVNPFLDFEGIIRVGGRLSDSGEDYWVKHPIVLPKNSHVSKLIVQHFHTLVCHQGRGMTCNIVRSNGFWIIGLRSMVSSMIYKCVICRKNRSVPLCQKMADLPKIRSEESPPFTFCGVDLFGPFSIREGRKVLKRYGVLFTCLASRANHLDVVNSLTTDAFIQAFRRFCAIRGPVKQLYSDQATNFVGASNELCKLDQNKIHEHLTSQNCEFFEWKINIPESSYKGGVLERQIRTVRSVLIQILSKQGDQLDDESLRTLMYETMSIVNSRPLSVDNMEDPNFPEPLTPNHIFTMKFKILLQPPGQFVNEDLYSRKRWRRIQYLLNVFWSRWKTEYANNLQVRTKWQTIKRNLKVGDIVMLKDEDSPRNQWPLARVIEAPEDEDGLVRHATILCANGKTFQRPIRSLFMILEQEENK